MASSLPTIYSPIDPPRRTPSPPSTPSIIEPADESSHEYEHQQNPLIANAQTTDPRSSLRRRESVTTSYLHPNSNSYLKPRAAAMGADHAPADDGSNAGAPNNPFNFQTQFITTSPVKSQNVGQRRGHRYKHSSISTQHQIFQEPPPRPPPVLPASLPVPTLREAWASMHRDQRARLYWSLCHAAVAVFVFFSASGSLALTALSHLVFFDVGSAAICVAVDVLGNFEVWRRSSVRHPFGLQRAEVLAGFAMSVFLVFGGFDLLSHNLKHLLEGMGGHEPHHQHTHPHADPGAPGAHAHAHGAPRVVGPGTVDLASLAAGISTLVGAYGLQNRARIGRAMRVRYPSYLSSLLPGVLANPFHFLTLLFAALLLLLPLLSVPMSVWLDRLICAAIAVSMFVLGTRLAVAQGLMLLMSYSGPSPPGGEGAGVASVLREIEAEPHVARVEDAQFWQVHYGLCLANLRVRVVRGCDDSALSLLRARVARVVQNRLGEGYGKGTSLRWEVTMQMSMDGH